jgi:hypothetical protein
MDVVVTRIVEAGPEMQARVRVMGQDSCTASSSHQSHSLTVSAKGGSLMHDRAANAGSGTGSVILSISKSFPLRGSISESPHDSIRVITYPSRHISESPLIRSLPRLAARI